MKMALEDQHPVLDMDISLSLKVKDLIKLNQILSQTYDEEEGLRETLSPILQEIRMVIHEIESNPEWTTLRKWDYGQELTERSAEKQKKYLKRIKKAMLKDRHLRIGYCAPGTGEITKRTVIPLDLWETDGQWLLRAYCYLEGEEHTFRLERIIKVKEKAPGKKRTRPAAPVWETAAPPMEADVEVLTEDLEEEAEEAIPPEAGEGAGTTEVPEAHGAPAETAMNPGKHPHYSLPGKKPHQPGLPNRLDRLIKRVEHKDH